MNLHTYCKSGVEYLIEKSGAKPARSRRCKEEQRCKDVTVQTYGKAQRSDDAKPEELPDEESPINLRAMGMEIRTST